MSVRRWALIFALTLGVMADTIVKNGFFNERPTDSEAMPPFWTMEKPAVGGWAFEDADGSDDATSIRFMSTKDAGPLTQKIALEPNTDFTLLFWYKSEGAKPRIAVKDSAGKNLLAFSPLAPKTAWQSAMLPFKSGAGEEHVLSLSGDGDGRVFFDSFEILPREEAAKRPQRISTPHNRNMALNKPYTLTTDPDYPLCKDPDDAVQLTDGVRTEGYFWTQKTTVGWYCNLPPIVIVDLGRTEPISGAAWSCAAGTAGVQWPNSILVFASEDKENWQLLGDLTYYGTRGKKAPDNATYSTFTYETEEFRAKGRYVAFLVKGVSGIFCDEVEVYGGDEAWLNLPGHYTISAKDGDFTDVLEKTHAASLIWKRLSLDMDSIMEGMKDSLASLSEADRGRLSAQAGECTQGLQAFHIAEDVATTSSELPLANYPLSAKILALNAFAQRAKGYAKPFAWKSNRWENVTLIGNAPEYKKKVSLAVTMMRGEVRSDAFSIANPTDQPQEFAIDVSAFSRSLGIKVLQAVVTDTIESETLSSALRELEMVGGKAKVTVPAGCNVQIWIMCHKPSAKAGTYSAKVKVKGLKNPNIVMNVEIVDIDFPKDPQLNVGGWEYAGTYNDMNRIANIEMLREIGVNSTWAKTDVMPMNPNFDAEGRLVNAAELDFSRFDAWTEDWPAAHFYCIANFMSKTEFFDEPIRNPRCANMLIDYFKALEDHMSDLKLKPEQLVFLFMDEPNTLEVDQIVVDFFKAVRKGNLKMQFFQDPIWPYPEQGMPEAFSLTDILCPNTPMMIGYGQSFKDFYNRQREDGRKLWLYSCSGPSKQLDPLHYWRGQAWQCHQIKANGSFFWAFGDTAGVGDSWDIYVRNNTEFSPYFVSRDGPPTDSKQAEGIRESIADFEYVKMLEAEIARVKTANPNHPALAAAEKALAEAPAEVVAAISQSTLFWNTGKDYDLLDRNAVRLLKALAALKK